MITVEDIKQRITSGIEGADVMVRLDGNKCLVAVGSPAFEGKRPVQKQQMIYACLNELIASGDLHAVSMQTYTPSQWQSQEKLGFPGF